MGFTGNLDSNFMTWPSSALHNMYGADHHITHQSVMLLLLLCQDHVGDLENDPWDQFISFCYFFYKVANQE